MPFTVCSIPILKSPKNNFRNILTLVLYYVIIKLIKGQRPKKGVLEMLVKTQNDFKKVIGMKWNQETQSYDWSGCWPVVDVNGDNTIKDVIDSEGHPTKHPYYEYKFDEQKDLYIWN